VVEKAALSYLNQSLLAPYGQAIALKLDSAARTLHAEVELKGESQSVEMDIIGYEITREGERYYATIGEIRTSREWLTTLALTQLRNRRFELPVEVGRLLMLAL
jgi:hypothetical protein